MKARLLALCVLTTALLAAACDEDPPETGYPTETPFESPAPDKTPVALVIPAGGVLVSTNGRISAPGEADQFTFTLAAADKVRIDVDAQGMLPPSNLLDAVITLYGPTGDVVAVADDGTNSWDAASIGPGALRDPYLVVSAPDSGLYTLVIEDANGNGGPVAGYNYDLSLSLVTPTLLEGGISCGTAVVLPAITTSDSVFSFTGTVNPVTSTDSCCGAQVLPCVGAPVSAKDVIYKATLTSGSRVQIARTGSGFDGAVYATTGCNGGSIPSIRDSCMAGSDGSSADGFVFTPLATTDYYIFVDGVNGSGGAFTLDVRILPQP